MIGTDIETHIRTIQPLPLRFYTRLDEFLASTTEWERRLGDKIE